MMDAAFPGPPQVFGSQRVRQLLQHDVFPGVLCLLVLFQDIRKLSRFSLCHGCSISRSSRGACETAVIFELCPLDSVDSNQDVSTSRCAQSLRYTLWALDHRFVDQGIGIPSIPFILE